ncbi:MAG: threonine aldolase family protein, partial [Deltaproteobacteria bacterium]|nr:threonine aldolase family protein [Deltaproteobacteria bacterium]
MIDLRSDTLTRPTQAMFDRMMNLDLGDETLFGDPTVKKLEEKAAAMTGKEAALFVASGTMGNLAAVLTHRAGRLEVLADESSHVACTEFGGMSVLAGLFCVRIPSRKGEMDLDKLRAAAAASCAQNRVPPALIAVETTHNHS